MTLPHLYAHVAPKYQPTLDRLVQPYTFPEIGAQLDVHVNTVDYHVGVILDSLGVERVNGVWRIQLTRMYYGIDPCSWCET